MPVVAQLFHQVDDVHVTGPVNLPGVSRVEHHMIVRLWAVDVGVRGASFGY